MHWEINGTDGDIIVSGPVGSLQLGGVKILGRTGDAALSELNVPDSYRAAPLELQGPAATVAEVYAAFANQLHGAGEGAPTFGDALVRHRMMDAIERSAAEGVVRTYAPN